MGLKGRESERGRQRRESLSPIFKKKYLAGGKEIIV